MRPVDHNALSSISLTIPHLDSLVPGKSISSIIFVPVAIGTFRSTLSDRLNAAQWCDKSSQVPQRVRVPWTSPLARPNALTLSELNMHPGAPDVVPMAAVNNGHKATWMNVLVIPKINHRRAWYGPAIGPNYGRLNS